MRKGAKGMCLVSMCQSRDLAHQSPQLLSFHTDFSASPAFPFPWRHCSDAFDHPGLMGSRLPCENIWLFSVHLTAINYLNQWETSLNIMKEINGQQVLFHFSRSVPELKTITQTERLTWCLLSQVRVLELHQSRLSHSAPKTPEACWVQPGYFLDGRHLKIFPLTPYPGTFPQR